MTDTRDSFEKIAKDLRSRAETADTVLGRVAVYELNEFARRITALQSGAGDGDRYRFCRDNWSKLTTVTVYGERGHYVEQIYLNTFGMPLLPESIDEAIDKAIATEGK